ncbi:MAG: hypothetical protein NTX66_03745 [Candidatus Falkowbacteria bacterium]|nr:hypothetical protein [Candidatus Falkowbacteria bacterium]
MILYINTADREKIIIALRQEAIGHTQLATGKIASAKLAAVKATHLTIAKQEFMASRSQAEKLLPAIDKLLKKNKVKLSDLRKIIVADSGGSFTSLRIGVATANALAYALNIPIEAENKRSKVKISQGIRIVKPLYDHEPSIGR